jgi:predicted DsbA family dithiol-disulfide isomerase
MTLNIEVYSDVICPWCFIGKQRLEKALASIEPKHEVRIHWLPFQLNPTMPKEGIDRKDYRIRKFGSWQRSQELDTQVVAAGESDGIQFAFDRIERTPNTLDAHRLIWLADQMGVQDAVMEGLFQAYFIAGQDISNSHTLVDTVVQAGLDRTVAEDVIIGDEGMDAIREVQVQARQIGVQGVPFFVVNGQIKISGAQPPEVFNEMFYQVLGSDPPRSENADSPTP